MSPNAAAVVVLLTFHYYFACSNGSIVHCIASEFYPIIVIYLAVVGRAEPSNVAVTALWHFYSVTGHGQGANYRTGRAIVKVLPNLCEFVSPYEPKCCFFCICGFIFEGFEIPVFSLLVSSGHCLLTCPEEPVLFQTFAVFTGKSGKSRHDVTSRP